jgi:hypothetical protein
MGVGEAARDSKLIEGAIRDVDAQAMHSGHLLETFQVASVVACN